MTLQAQKEALMATSNHFMAIASRESCQEVKDHLIKSAKDLKKWSDDIGTINECKKMEWLAIVFYYNEEINLEEMRIVKSFPIDNIQEAETYVSNYNLNFMESTIFIAKGKHRK